MISPIIVSASTAFLAASTTNTSSDGSLVGIAFGIAIGGVIGLFIVITLIIILSKCLIRKHRAHKIKRAIRAQEKKERDALEKARREYQHGSTGRLGPIIGEVVDVEISGLPFPSRVTLSDAKPHRNKISRFRSGVNVQKGRSAKSTSAPKAAHKSRHNWLWWRRMEMTSTEEDIEAGTSRRNPSLSPSPSSSHSLSNSLPPPYQELEHYPPTKTHTQAQTQAQNRPRYTRADTQAHTQAHSQAHTHPRAQANTRTESEQATAAAAAEKHLLQTQLENDKGPNIVVAFWGFLRSWARVERGASAGGR